MTEQSLPDYDLLVIGGGIHGAGVAQAAAAAGHSVLVIEQGEVASGTSSRSSKLIHGGLRYLEHGQYSLVRECLRERALLLKLAPGLVQLRPFFIPIYADSSRNRFLVRAGLSLYSMLGGLTKDSQFRSLPRQEWNSLDGLKKDKLRAVFQYWDAQTDDVQLTRSVMASAQKLGTELQSNTEFCSAKRTPVGQREGQWEVRYRNPRRNNESMCTAGAIVNAAGPWVNAVLARMQPTIAQKNISLVQGAHLVLEGEAPRGIYYLESPSDHRPVFVMPWQIKGDAVEDEGKLRSAVLLGTTETNFEGDPATVKPLPEEQAYLLEAYQHYFQSQHFSEGTSRSDPTVLDAFAGLRVLPMGEKLGEGEHASRPRETILQTDQENSPSLVSVYGGKLTTYRSTSQKVLRLLEKSMPDRVPVADTESLPLERVPDN